MAAIVDFKVLDAETGSAYTGADAGKIGWFGRYTNTSSDSSSGPHTLTNTSIVWDTWRKGGQASVYNYAQFLNLNISGQYLSYTTEGFADFAASLESFSLTGNYEILNSPNNVRITQGPYVEGKYGWPKPVRIYGVDAAGQIIYSASDYRTDYSPLLQVLWRYNPGEYAQLTITMVVRKLRKVTLNANGGSTETKTVRANSKYPLVLPNPGTKTGYEFDGWYNGTVRVGYIGDSYTPSADVTLTANWVGKPHTVTFDATGGSATPTSKIVRYKAKFGSLPTATRQGYIFDGWYVSKSIGATEITSETVFEELSDITLYAHWTQTYYTITYNLNGGTQRGILPSSVNSGVWALVYAPERDGYRFLGWMASGIDTSTAKYKYDGGNETPITSASTKFGAEESTCYICDLNSSALGAEVTLTASWQLLTFTVTFDANGGTVVPASTTGNAESPITLPEPTLVGSIFRGWFTGLTGGTKIGDAGEEYVPSADVTVYAKWLGRGVVVTFDPRGGSMDSGFLQLNVGDKYGTLPEPYSSGKTFEGWYLDDEVTKITSDSIVTVSDDHTLYARWSIDVGDTYTIVFFDRTGTNETSTAVIETNKTQRIPDFSSGLKWIKPSGKAVDTVKLWVDASGNYYEDGAEVTNLAAPDGTVVLYANWIAEKNIVTLHYSETRIETTTVETGAVIGYIESPTRAGYKFVGWYLEEDYRTKVTAMYVVMTDVTLYAKWEKSQTYHIINIKTS